MRYRAGTSCSQTTQKLAAGCGSHPCIASIVTTRIHLFLALSVRRVDECDSSRSVPACAKVGQLLSSTDALQVNCARVAKLRRHQPARSRLGVVKAPEVLGPWAQHVGGPFFLLNPRLQTKWQGRQDPNHKSTHVLPPSRERIHIHTHTPARTFDTHTRSAILETPLGQLVNSYCQLTHLQHSMLMLSPGGVRVDVFSAFHHRSIDCFALPHSLSRALTPTHLPHCRSSDDLPRRFGFSSLVRP